MTENKFGPLPEDRADSANESMGRPRSPQSGIGYPRGAHPFPCGERMPGQGNPAVKMPFGEAGAVSAPNASHFGVSFTPDDALHPEPSVADQRPGAVPVPPGFPGYPGAVPTHPCYPDIPGYPGYSGASPATAGAPSPIRKAAVPDPSGNPGMSPNPGTYTGSCPGSYPGAAPYAVLPGFPVAYPVPAYDVPLQDPVVPGYSPVPHSPPSSENLPCFHASMDNYGICALEGVRYFDDVSVVYDNFLYRVKDSQLIAEYDPIGFQKDSRWKNKSPIIACIRLYAVKGRFYLIATGAEGAELDDRCGHRISLGGTPVFIPLSQSAANNCLLSSTWKESAHVYPHSFDFGFGCVAHENGSFVLKCTSDEMYIVASLSPRFTLYPSYDNAGWFWSDEPDGNGLYMGEVYLHLMTPGELKHWAEKFFSPDKCDIVLRSIEDNSGNGWH